MVYGQTILLSEDFNTGMPGNFNIVDADGNAPNSDEKVNFISDGWVLRMDYDSTSADSIAVSTSWFESADAANDYLILPAVTFGSFGNYIYWDARSIDASNADGYQLLYSSSPEPTSFTDTLFWVKQELSFWQNHKIELPDSIFADTTLHFAFRNNSYDKFILALDNIKVEKENPISIFESTVDGFKFYPNPATKYLIVESSVKKKSTITISDLLGRQRAKLNTGFPKLNIPLSNYNLSPGIYFLTVNERTRRLVIKE